MAVSFTIDGVQSVGNMKWAHGTFTSADGDTSASLANATHGFNYVVGYQFTFDTGGVAVPTPKATISGGTITLTFDNSQGYSGKWWVMGR